MELIFCYDFRLFVDIQQSFQFIYVSLSLVKNSNWSVGLS